MSVEWIYTAKDSKDRLCHYRISERSVEDRAEAWIKIEPDIKYQTIIGFGGAFTDTAAGALSQMSEELQERVLKSYFDPEEGIGYNIGRVPIGACDFSRELYSLAEKDNDIRLEGFSIEYDKKGIIPMIHKAKTYMQDAEELYLYALPWSPPEWMKTNATMLHGGHLKEGYYAVMAEYLMKFIDEYKEAGIQIRGITTQNEPDEIQKWPSCIYSHEEEREMLRLLEPEAQKRGLKILCWDSNRTGMRERVEYMMEDQVLRRTLDGVAFHGYSEGGYEELDRLHEEFPALTLCATEYCTVMADQDQEWFLAEKYAQDMLMDFNHWTSLWMDWNLCLDENSGPKFVDNPCSAPIILDKKEQKIVYKSTFYYIAHFSKYIQRGAVRINTVTGEHSPIHCCAFENPDRSLSVIIINDTDKKNELEVRIADRSYMIHMDEHSIGTLRVMQDRP